MVWLIIVVETAHAAIFEIYFDPLIFFDNHFTRDYDGFVWIDYVDTD